jgi:serine/threonine-protein kinase RsbW
MSVATQPQGGVRVAIARDPALVRTVRLVAAALARRSECPEPLIEEIRLAIGEACAVMIGLEEADQGSDEQIEIKIHTDGDFSATVTGRVGDDDGNFAEIGLDPWALLRGLCEDLTVDEDGAVTTVGLSWPR